MEKKPQDNAIHDEYYKWPKYIQEKKWLIWPIGLFLFFSIFLYNLSPSEKIIAITQNVLNKSLPCNLNYKNIEVEYLFPKVLINSVDIPTSCSDGLIPKLHIKKIGLGFNGLSFFPFGLKFKSQITLKKIPLDIVYVQGWGKSSIIIENNDYALNELSNIIDGIQLDGIAHLLIKIHLDKQFQLDSFETDISSNNAQIPSFAISFLPPNFPPQAPPLNINLGALTPNLINIQSSYVGGAKGAEGGEEKSINESNDNNKKNKTKKNVSVSFFEVKKFQFGDAKSKIQLNIEGKITPDWNNMQETGLNLDIAAQFEKDFLDKNSFLNLLMPGDQGTNGKFHFKLEGVLSEPKQTSVKQNKN